MDSPNLDQVAAARDAASLVSQTSNAQVNAFGPDEGYGKRFAMIRREADALYSDLDAKVAELSAPPTPGAEG